MRIGFVVVALGIILFACANCGTLLEGWSNERAANRAAAEANAAYQAAQKIEAAGRADAHRTDAKTRQTVDTANAHAYNVAALAELSQQNFREDTIFALTLGLDPEHYVRLERANSLMDRIGPVGLSLLGVWLACMLVATVLLAYLGWRWNQRQEVI